jgi:hypothetical protein
MIVGVSLVGARKIVVDIEEFKSPMKELLERCNVIQILAEGSEGHTKAGLAKNKVLVKAYRQNTRSKANG